MKSCQMVQIVYDAEVMFCNRLIERRFRTYDQMGRLARSGKQNIAPGSMAFGTSRKTELKLMEVARTSLEGFLLDYQDYLHQGRLSLWVKDHPQVKRVRVLCY